MAIRKLVLLVGVVALLLGGCSSSDSSPRDVGPAVLNQVHLSASPAQLTAETDAALTAADGKVEQILAAGSHTFENTVVALNDLLYEIDKASQVPYLLLCSSPDPAMRDAAQQAYLKTDRWRTQLFFNEELDRAIEARPLPSVPG